MENFLESYLVKLSASPDSASFDKFKGVLDSSEKQVASYTGGITKRILEAQISIVGSFTSISAAILGVVDRAAMADQSFRLLGLRMLMGTEQARKMSLITSTLGASLEEIIWDPELHARAIMMGKDIDMMTAGLGQDFEKSMASVREFRAEFGRLEIGLQFLGMRFAEDLWKRIMPGEAGKTFHDWITEMERRIPEFSQDLVQYAVPALEKTWTIVKGVGEVAQGAAVVFTNLIGILSGDKSIEGTAFSFDKVAKSIEHVGDWMVELEKWIVKAEMALTHFATGIALLFEKNYSGAVKQFYSGMDEFKEPSAIRGPVETAGDIQSAKQDRSQRLQDSIATDYGIEDERTKMLREIAQYDNKSLTDIASNIGKQAVKSQLAGSDAAKVLRDLPFLWNKGSDADKLFGLSAPQSQAPSTTENAPQSGRGTPSIRFSVPTEMDGRKLIDSMGMKLMSTNDEIKANKPIAQLMSKQADIIAAIEAAADKTSTNQYPVSRALALAIAHHESRFRNDVTSEKGAMGIMQLMPDTAKYLGVDPTDAQQNIEGGVKLLSQLLARYKGDKIKALEAYDAGPGRVDRSTGLADLPPETRKYIPEVLKDEEFFSRAAKGQPDAIDRAMPPAAPTKPTALWMQPPAYDLPSTSMADRDWAGAMASYQSPIVPQANVSHSSKTITVDVGGITIMQPGADEATISRIVKRDIVEALNEQTQSDLVQLSAPY